MLENTIEQTNLTTPADAIELSMDELEEVTGAGFGGGSFSCFGGGFSCFTAFQFNVAFSECLEFVTFGSCFSCEGGFI